LFKVNITEIVGLPQLSGSKGIEIRPKTSGVVPVTISGDSGAKLDGFLDPHLNFKQIGDNVEFNAPVNLFIAESLSYQSSSTITSTHNKAASKSCPMIFDNRDTAERHVLTTMINIPCLDRKDLDIGLIYYGFLIIKTLSIFLGACFKIR
jgi:hypothetical protein